jgi:uncharacterized protein YjbI with pentapeptide repeats
MKHSIPSETLLKSLDNSQLYRSSGGTAGKIAYLAYDSYDQLDLHSAVFVDATLQETALTNCILDGAAFPWAMANGMKLNGSSVIGATFVDTQLEGAEFVNCNLTNIDMRECTIEEANFTGANLTGATISDCTGYLSCFLNANLTNTNLSNTSFYGANFVGAVMRGTVLTGAMMDEQTMFLPTTPVELILAEFIWVGNERIDGQIAVHCALEKLRIDSLRRHNATQPK